MKNILYTFLVFGLFLSCSENKENDLKELDLSDNVKSTDTVSFEAFEKYGNNTDAIELCKVLQKNNFGTDTEAERGLDRILSVIGASKRFVLQPCANINNAVAASYKGIRYIFYDRDFMSSVNSGNNWENLFILAHEVGHHINGHSLDLVLYTTEVVEAETLVNQRKQELEADEFAGFILGKLGATFEQTSSTINLTATNKDDTYSTHPSKSKRLAAIYKGHKKATEKEINPYENPSKFKTSEEYYYSGDEKLKLKDYVGATADFTKAIELDPNDAKAYQARMISNLNLGEEQFSHSLFLADAEKLIELQPNDSRWYEMRAASTVSTDPYAAIDDWTKVIEISIKKFEIGSGMHNPYLQRGLIKNDLEFYKGAIADFTKAIEVDPNSGEAYAARASAKLSYYDGNNDCDDWKKAAALGHTRAALIADEYCN